jgi:hypothetical protein
MASRFGELRSPRVGLSAPSAAASLRSLAAGSASIPLATASLLQNCNKDAFLFFPDYLPFGYFVFASATVAIAFASVFCLIASVLLLFSTVAASAHSFKIFFCLFMPASRSFQTKYVLSAQQTTSTAQQTTSTAQQTTSTAQQTTSTAQQTASTAQQTTSTAQQTTSTAQQTTSPT